MICNWEKVRTWIDKFQITEQETLYTNAVVGIASLFYTIGFWW